MEKKYKILAKFKYANKEYFIVQTGEKRMDFVIKDKEGFTTEIKEEDFEIIKCVYNALKINTEKSVSVGYKKIDGHEFKIFYDLNTKLYYWYKIENNIFTEANYVENRKLNFQYNHIPSVVYLELSSEEELDSNKSNKSQDYIQRIIKNGKKAIFVLVAAGISLTSFSQCEARQIEEHNEHSLKENTSIVENIELSTITNDTYDYNRIKAAIEQNENLSEEEKEFLYKLKFVFDENHQYMNLDLIEERLKNLKIEYNKVLNGGVQGQFILNNDEIHTIYSDLKSSKKSVFLHEVLHVFQDIDNVTFTMELSNEMATREILRRMCEMGLLESKEFKNLYGTYTEFGDGYSPYLYAQYMLSELLTQEQLQSYQWSTDNNVIIDRLLEIDGKDNVKDEAEQEQMYKRALKLLDTINSCRKCDEETGTFQYEYELKDYFRNYNDIYKQIDYYYTKLKGKTMEETLGIGLWDYDMTNKLNEWSSSAGVDLQVCNRDEKKCDLFSFTRQNAKIKTMREFTNADSNVSNDSVFVYMYYLPRTYFSNVRKYPVVYFNPERCENFAVEINEDVESFYLQQLQVERKREEKDENYTIYEDETEKKIKTEEDEELMKKVREHTHYVFKDKDDGKER